MLKIRLSAKRDQGGGGKSLKNIVRVQAAPICLSSLIIIPCDGLSEEMLSQLAYQYKIKM